MLASNTERLMCLVGIIAKIVPSSPLTVLAGCACSANEAMRKVRPTPLTRGFKAKK